MSGLESYLEEHYQITNAVVQELTGLSAATICRYLQLSVNQGLLEKIRKYKKHYLFAHIPLIIRSFLRYNFVSIFPGN